VKSGIRLSSGNGSTDLHGIAVFRPLSVTA
jgi:hypothetical protein